LVLPGCPILAKTHQKRYHWPGHCPVVGISWDDARAYCDWLSDKTGLNFKLPTEAQWEKAARGIESRKYPWGDQEPDETLANFGTKIGKTTLVGSYPKGVSFYGLLDIAGNVWEWCRDWYDVGYYKNSPLKNPQGPASGSNHVVRGGGWDYVAWYLRCTDRDYITIPGRGSRVGFRLCMEVSEHDL
jgi:formylglycine-generating enzyme required for sulfatase activity